MISRTSIKRLAIFGLAMGVSAPAALAHPSLDHAAGLVHGFMHPVSGYDHVLAMLAVGLLAVRLSGRALWVVPAAFMSVMVLGASMGSAGIQIPFVEFGIVTSVVVLAGLASIGTRLSTAFAASVAAFFAVFHGFAHGAEIPASVGGVEFAFGFIAATAVLHGAGIVAGLAAKALAKPQQKRSAV